MRVHVNSVSTVRVPPTYTLECTEDDIIMLFALVTYATPDRLREAFRTLADYVIGYNGEFEEAKESAEKNRVTLNILQYKILLDALKKGFNDAENI